MSWISSTIGVVSLAFTDFEFNKVFFFRPLIIVMMVTYFIGCYFLPALLVYLDFDICRLGKVDLIESVYATKSIMIAQHEGTHRTEDPPVKDSDGTPDDILGEVPEEPLDEDAPEEPLDDVALEEAEDKE